MIYLLGFRTPNTDEVPEVLYIGTDGNEVERIAAKATHPRLARMVNPVLYPLRHWSEEASATHEASRDSIHPTTAAAPGETHDNPGAAASSEEAPASPAPAEDASQVQEPEAPAEGTDDAPTIGEPPKPRRRH